MKLLEISDMEFRKKQSTYLKLADQGVKIIIKRSKKQSYLLTPIPTEIPAISPIMELKIEKALISSENGNTTKIHTEEELHNLLANL